MTDALFAPQTPGAIPSPGAPPAASLPLHVAGGAIVITVYGKAGPQGSKRHVGNGVMIESSKKVKPWREAVKAAALEAMDGLTRIEDAPVHVNVIFCFDKPKSAPKRRRTWPITRSSGDVDKLQRSTFDALTDAGVIKDDSQIVQVRADKVFTDDPAAPLTVPGAFICVLEVTSC